MSGLPLTAQASFGKQRNNDLPATIRDQRVALFRLWSTVEVDTVSRRDRRNDVWLLDRLYLLEKLNVVVDDSGCAEELFAWRPQYRRADSGRHRAN